MCARSSASFFFPFVCLEWHGWTQKQDGEREHVGPPKLVHIDQVCLATAVRVLIGSKPALRVVCRDGRCTSKTLLSRTMLSLTKLRWAWLHDLSASM